MNIHEYHKVRLSVDCTEEERKYIKMLAAKEGKSISEYLLTFARKQMPKRPKRVPNKRTEKALREAQKESGEVYESIDEFWKAMGIELDED